MEEGLEEGRALAWPALVEEWRTNLDRWRFWVRFGFANA